MGRDENVTLQHNQIPPTTQKFRCKTISKKHWINHLLTYSGCFKKPECHPRNFAVQNNVQNNMQNIVSPKKRALRLTRSHRPNWNPGLNIFASRPPFVRILELSRPTFSSKSVADWGDLRAICQGSSCTCLDRSFLRYIGLPRPIRGIHGFSYPFIELTGTGIIVGL